MSNVLEQLAAVVDARRGASPDSSYVASLFNGGLESRLYRIELF